MSLQKCSVGVGSRLKKARKAKKLSRSGLAEAAGLTDTTVRRIEEGHVFPGIDTIEALASALAVSACWLAYGVGAPMTQGLAYRIAPGFDSIKMAEELSAKVHGRGGHIDDVYKYLDPMGAANWCALVSTAEYAAMIESMPIREAAIAIHQHTGNGGLDVLALGAGTGRHEAKLVSHLVALGQKEQRLYLVDISQPLLSNACQSVSNSLAGYSDIEVTAIQGDFHRLPTYVHLIEAPPQPRLVCMFGYTFCNLENELRFVRNSLQWLAPGDLLLLDLAVVVAPVTDTAAIHKRERAFVAKRSPEFQRRVDDFMTGPLRRYFGELADISVRPAIDVNSCSIPGSYALDMRATVHHAGKADAEFSVGYAKRYDLDKLAITLAVERWKQIERWAYGDGTTMLALFQRQ